MEIGFNNDTWYFTIQCKDIPSFQSKAYGKDATIMLNDNIISLTVTEELKKFRTGTLSVRDPHHVYSSIFRSGMAFELEWGYKQLRTTPFGTPPVSVRKGAKCIIQQPSGGGDESGVQTYDISFFATEILNPKLYRVFTTGTVGSVVTALMTDLGVTVPTIDFTRMNVAVTHKDSIRQSESAYNTLYKLAQQNKCLFQIDHISTGGKAGIFVDYEKSNSAMVKAYMASVVGSINGVKELYYNFGQDSNVRSYSWNQNIGENGTGDYMEIELVAGEAKFVRRTAETETISFYQLNPDRMKKALAKCKDQNERMALTAAVANEKTFEGVKHYFDKDQTTTAPQGLGFEIHCSMIGDPQLTPLMRVHFKNGFPSSFYQNQEAAPLCDFLIRKATHTISKGGYFTEVDIADLFTVNGSFLEHTTDVGSYQNG